MTTFQEQIQSIMLTDEQLDKLLLDGQQIAGTFFDADGLFPQVVIATLGKEAPYDLTVVAVMGGFDGQGKRIMLQNCGMQFYNDKKLPLAVMLISECWVSREVVGQRRKYLMPEDDPNRGEVVMVQLYAMDRKTRAATRQVVTSESGKEMAGEWEQLTGDYQANLLRNFYSGFFALAADRQVRRR